MIINEVKRTYCDRFKEIIKEYRHEVNKGLKELGLDDLVIRVKDGKVGKLYMIYEPYSDLNYSLKFYPLRKDGKESLKSDGYIMMAENIEEQFKPYKGVDNEKENTNS